MIVKVPLTRAGIQACKALSGEGIRVNVTLCFSAAQALLAAKAGATFVSPFVGRLDDIATNGMDLIREIVDIYNNYDFTTEVLVASCRHPIHVTEAARMGADICHLPAGGDRHAVQSSADQHRSREIPQGLGEIAGSESLKMAEVRPMTDPLQRWPISNAAPSSAVARSASIDITRPAS